MNPLQQSALYGNYTQPPASVGVQAKSPVTPASTNLLPSNQVKKTTPVSSTKSTTNGTSGSNSGLPNGFSLSTLQTQKALNAKGAGLTEDGLMGPKTQAAIAKYSTPAASTNTSTVSTPSTTTAQTAPTGYTPNAGLYGQLITGAANTAAGSQAVGQQAQDIAAKAGQQISDIGKQAAQTEGEYNTGIISPRAQGLNQIVAQTAAGQQQAVAQGASQALQGTSQALTGQSQAQNALQSAGNAAAPQLASYSQQAFNPVTGSFSGGTTGGSLNDAVSNVIQKLTSGQMTYDQATQALSGYGQGGIDALQKALPSGYSASQSSTLSAQQGSIKPAYDYATKAVSNLETTLGNLGFLQSTNIPAVNAGANWFSKTFGVNSDATRAYTGAVAEARSAIQKLLASTQGGTPTDYVGQSNALLPDEPTPNDIAAAKQTLEKLGGAKVNIYGNPGTSNSTSGSQTEGSTITTPYGSINPNL